jgi:hypothetical protein
MTWAVLEREATRAVEAMAPAAESVGPGWRFPIGAQPGAPNVDVCVEDGWILLDAALESAALSQNLLEARRGCELAASLARGGREPGGGASPGRGDSRGDEPVGPVSTGELERLCEEAGWVSSQRSSGRLAVELEGTEGFCQAQLGRRADGAVALSVEFDDGQPALGVCGEAMAIFLLRCCGWLRMVRSVGASAGEGASPRFEVIFAVGPSPSELSEALAALSVCVRFNSRELLVLARSEVVARSYLARNPRFVRPTAAKRARKKAKAAKSGAKGRATTATGAPTSI